MGEDVFLNAKEMDDDDDCVFVPNSPLNDNALTPASAASEPLGAEQAAERPSSSRKRGGSDIAPISAKRQSLDCITIDDASDADDDYSNNTNAVSGSKANSVQVGAESRDEGIAPRAKATVQLVDAAVQTDVVKFFVDLSNDADDDDDDCQILEKDDDDVIAIGNNLDPVAARRASDEAPVAPEGIVEIPRQPSLTNNTQAARHVEASPSAVLGDGKQVQSALATNSNSGPSRPPVEMPNPSAPEKDNGNKENDVDAPKQLPVPAFMLKNLDQLAMVREAVMKELKRDKKLRDVVFQIPEVPFWEQSDWITENDMAKIMDPTMPLKTRESLLMKAVLKQLRTPNANQSLGPWSWKFWEIEWRSVIDPKAELIRPPIHVECWHDVTRTELPKDFEFCIKNTITDEAAKVIKKDIDLLCDSCNCRCRSKACAACKQMADGLIVCGLAKNGKMVTELRPKEVESRRVIFVCPENCDCSNKIRMPDFVRTVPLMIFHDPFKQWTVRAGDDLKEGQVVSEYVGEVTTKKQAKRDTSYQFEVGNVIVDAMKMGNESRFVSHSCEPNMAVVSIYSTSRPDGFHRLVYVALRDIKMGEELTIDYHPQYATKNPKDTRPRPDKRPRKSDYCRCETRYCREWL